MHIMIDLETMSLAPNAALVFIGAVMMNAQAETLKTFERSISLESSVHAGLQIDPSTVMWWMRQSDAARQSLAKSRTPIKEALEDFADWLPPFVEGMWGNGATADNVWLVEAYKAVGLPRPWTYQKDRCYRTFRAMHFNVDDPIENELAHNALSDAQWQADFMRNVCRQKGLVLT